jgi:hypothetical protein
MARKKSRPAPARVPSRAPLSADHVSTAISGTRKPSSTAVSATAPNNAPSRRDAAPPERSMLEIIVIRGSRWLGSLQVAVVGLSLFAAVVLLGTLMEHWYSTKIAQDLVYKSWWFIGLLLVLAVNIFFAAAKKWPWKKHQTGFVITHIGLLLMLFGGILNAWFGVDAQLYVLDSNEPAAQERARQRYGMAIPQQTDLCRYSDPSMITIQEMTAAGADPHAGLGGRFKNDQTAGAPKGKLIERDFEGGPLPWYPDEKTAGRTDLGLALLGRLSSPFGRRWSESLGSVSMEVIDYLPLARFVPYGPADKDSRGMPALRLQFSSPKFGEIDQWISLTDPQLLNDELPAQIELLGFCPPRLLEHFLNPPAPVKNDDDKGVLLTVDKGVLTVVVGDEAFPLPVNAFLGKKQKVAPGVEVELTEYKPDGLGKEMPLAKGPVVKFKVHLGRGEVDEVVLFAGLTGLTLKNGKIAFEDPNDPVLYWYHPPDVRLGRSSLKGLMQLVVSEGNKLFYRSFTKSDKNGDKGALTKESSGKLTPGEDFVDVFKRMEGRVRVPEFLPSASQQPHYVAANVTPGKETDTDKEHYPPALQAELSDGMDKTTFWLPFGERRTVELKGRRFTIAFSPKTMKLGFDIKLQRALTTVDPGTRMPATYSSWVQVFDVPNGIDGERRMITMNEPLDHRGYKFYQSQLAPLGIEDSTGRPVNLSVFTVGYDPGLNIKYLGSVCLAAGIFMMFYMRAYFFRGPRRRQEASPEAPLVPAANGLAPGAAAP